MVLGTDQAICKTTKTTFMKLEKNKSGGEKRWGMEWRILYSMRKRTSLKNANPLERVCDTVLQLQGVQPRVAACSVAPSAGESVVSVIVGGEVTCIARHKGQACLQF